MCQCHSLGLRVWGAACGAEVALSVQMLGNLMSSHVVLDGSGVPKFTSVGINRLLLRGRQCRRHDLCPLDWAPPEAVLGHR